MSLHPSTSTIDCLHAVIWGEGQIVFVNSGVFLTKVEPPSSGNITLGELFFGCSSDDEADDGANRFQVVEGSAAEGSVKITIELAPSSDKSGAGVKASVVKSVAKSSKKKSSSDK